MVTPGKRTAPPIAATSRSVVIPGLHSPGSRSTMVVSAISNPAGSVAVEARPAFPKTLLTSGKEGRILSCRCRMLRACATPIPGRVVGMKRIVPVQRRHELAAQAGHRDPGQRSEAMAPATAGHRQRSVQRMAGR